MKATISGDFSVTITMRVEETSEAIGSKPRREIQTRTARWVGEVCADGMIPGDVMSDGRKANVTPLVDREVRQRLEDLDKEARGLGKTVPQLIM